MSEAGAPKGAWWLLLLVGVLSVVAGVILLFKPSDSLATLAVIAGIFLLVDGLLELIYSLLGDAGDRGTVALLGVLTAIIGVLLIRHPVGGITAVALLIGIWLIAVGVLRFVTAFGDYENRGWHALAGLVELIAGIVIVADPSIGYTTLAILVGIAFILNGLAMAALGWGLHEAGGEVADTRPEAS